MLLDYSPQNDLRIRPEWPAGQNPPQNVGIKACATPLKYDSMPRHPHLYPTHGNIAKSDNTRRFSDAKRSLHSVALSCGLNPTRLAKNSAAKSVTTVYSTFKHELGLCIKLQHVYTRYQVQVSEQDPRS